MIRRPCGILITGFFAVVLANLGPAEAFELRATEERMLHRRDGGAPLVIERVAATADGVQATVISSGLEREQLVEWDRIADIDPKSRGSLEAGVESGIEPTGPYSGEGVPGSSGATPRSPVPRSRRPSTR